MFQSTVVMAGHDYKPQVQPGWLQTRNVKPLFMYLIRLSLDEKTCKIREEPVQYFKV